jgi:hypothetical protein
MLNFDAPINAIISLLLKISIILIENYSSIFDICLYMVIFQFILRLLAYFSFPFRIFTKQKF